MTDRDDAEREARLKCPGLVQNDIDHEEHCGWCLSVIPILAKMLKEGRTHA